MNETSVTVAGLSLPLMQSPRGPLLSINHPEIEPLAWLINLALDGGLKDLRARMQSGQDVHYKGLHAARQSSGEYRLWGDFFGTSMTLPPESVLDTLARLDALHEASRRTPPSPPAQEPAEPPRPALDPAVEPTAAPRAPQPLEELEARAAELDRLTRRDRTLENVVEESAKRRFLLLDLEATGIFEPGPDLPEALPTLRSYRAAGLQVAQYLVSDVRRRFNPDCSPGPVVGSPVSVDWFRFPSPGPSHLTAEEWLAFLENILVNGGASGGQGEVFVHVGPAWWTLWFRCDDGVHPTVVAIKPPSTDGSLGASQVNFGSR